MTKKSTPNPHALFVPNPMHHFSLKVDGREVPVTTDIHIPAGGKLSAAYIGKLLDHIERVELEFNRPIVHAARFFR